MDGVRDDTPVGGEPPPLPPGRPRAPAVRSKLMLEVASELVGRGDWPHKQARIDLRVQGPYPWEVRLVASDGPDMVAEVLGGTADFGILNPATALGPALDRLGEAPEVMASIATVPSYDQLGLAVSSRYGITHLEELAEARPPLVLSLRAQRNHSVHQVIEDVLGAAGVALADIERWGGRLVYHDSLPHRSPRVEAIGAGEVDAVFDEGIYNWVGLGTEAGLTFLGVGDEAMTRLEALGYRRAVLRRQRFPELAADVDTVDFSGFLVYTRADTADGLVTAFCDALHTRADRIPWQGGPELPLAYMVSDAVDAPLPVPLHRAAATFWEAHLDGRSEAIDR